MSSTSAWTWLPTDWTALPLFAIWLVGIVVALARWGRHPRVSAIMVGGLASMLVLNVAQRVGLSFIIHSARSPGQPIASMSVYLGIFGLVSSLLRAGAWGAVLVALFGWRQASSAAAASPPFQFSIRGLMILTLAVALLCGMVRGLIALLGESAMYLINVIDDIPLVICWIIGMRVALVRWRAHPQVSKFALLGIGMSLATLVFWQMIWMWAVAHGFPPFSLLATTLLAAGGWALMLIAVFGWRESAVLARNQAVTAA